MKLKFILITMLIHYSDFVTSQCETTSEFSKKLEVYNLKLEAHPIYRGEFLNEFSTERLKASLNLLKAQIDLMKSVNTEIDFIYASSVPSPESIIPFEIMSNQFWRKNSSQFILEIHPEFINIYKLIKSIHEYYNIFLKIKSKNIFITNGMIFFNNELRVVKVHSEDNYAINIIIHFKNKIIDYSNFELFEIEYFSCGFKFLTHNMNADELNQVIIRLRKTGCKPYLELANKLELVWY